MENLIEKTFKKQAHKSKLGNIMTKQVTRLMTIINKRNTFFI